MKDRKEGLGITIASAILAIANLIAFVICFWAQNWRLVVPMKEAENMISYQPIWWLAVGILWTATTIINYQTYFVIGKKKGKKE